VSDHELSQSSRQTVGLEQPKDGAHVQTVADKDPTGIETSTHTAGQRHKHHLDIVGQNEG
jgi:hypothetical protein